MGERGEKGMGGRRKQLSREQTELIQRAHQEAMHRGAPSYEDPVTGGPVFTAAHHLERGYCCDCACRHCPYPKSRRLLTGVR